MSRINKDQLMDSLLKKKENFNVRVTTFIHGSTKNQFLDDCIKRDFNESKMASHIIDVYYSTMNSNNNLSKMEMLDIKKYIIDKIKL